MSIIDTLTGYIAPHDCLVCEKEGALLCRDCWQTQVHKVPERCYRCQASSPSGRTCRGCRAGSHIYSVQAAASYAGAAKALVWHLKFHGAQAASCEMAVYMESLTRVLGRPHIIPVPTASGRVRRRGYDQARLLAREFSKQTGLPLLNCLARRSQAHQVGASRSRRLRQLESAFYVPYRVRASLPPEVILIDDVITTGATLEAAAKTLKSSGVKRVSAITFARA